jgi:hypothetical protein
MVLQAGAVFAARSPCEWHKQQLQRKGCLTMTRYVYGTPHLFLILCRSSTCVYSCLLLSSVVPQVGAKLLPLHPTPTDSQTLLPVVPQVLLQGLPRAALA